MEKSVSTKKLDDGGLIFRFDHVKDAQIALNTTRSLFSLGSFIPGWSAVFVPAADFHGDHSRDYEGQLKVAITYQGQGQCTDDWLRELAVAAVEDQVSPPVAILSTKIKTWEADKYLLALDIELASVRAAELLSNKYKHEWKSLPGHQVSSMLFQFLTPHLTSCRTSTYSSSIIAPSSRCRRSHGSALARLSCFAMVAVQSHHTAQARTCRQTQRMPKSTSPPSRTVRTSAPQS